ncbi:MAG: FkbM family methyltransferase [Chitinophagaceae bacterium BSSC1]|nr:MAG: FkbM family methyltransferase [Chitinophagaceae bacterium BSSC1]
MKRQQPIRSLAKTILALLPIALTKNERYDRLTKRIIQQVCQPNSNCIDIGAHEGRIFSMMLDAAPQGRHHAFEPIPALYEQLKKDFGARAMVHQQALSNQSGLANFNLVLSNPALSGIKKRPYWKKEIDSSIQVTTEVLDHLINPTEQIDLIKMDVEGAELWVLEGAINTIQRCQPAILFECGKMGGQAYDFSAKDAFDLLDLRLKYRIFTLDAWLKNAPALIFQDFQTHFEQGTEFFFFATPK